MKRRRHPAGLVSAGLVRPSSPVSIFGEDFSLIVRKPRRLRVTRWKIRVLS